MSLPQSDFQTTSSATTALYPFHPAEAFTHATSYNFYATIYSEFISPSHTFPFGALAKRWSFLCSNNYIGFYSAPESRVFFLQIVYKSLPVWPPSAEGFVAFVF